MGILNRLSNKINGRKYFEAPGKLVTAFYFKDWQIYKGKHGAFEFYHPDKKGGLAEIKILHNTLDRHYNFIESQIEKYKEYKPVRFQKGDQHHLKVHKFIEHEEGLLPVDLYITSTVKTLMIGNYTMPPKKEWGPIHKRIKVERKEADRMFRTMELL